MKRYLALAVFILSSMIYGVTAEEITKPETDLPKIVLIGDSIRLSYTASVVKELEGRAVVFSPKPNGQDSRNVLKNLDAWAIKQQPAIVHFNCGIHDTKKFKSTGKFQVSPEEYETNLRKIVEQIRDKTDAVVIFATSTPIIDDRAAKVRAERDYELLNASIEQYNAIAKKVMTDLKVPINDLNATLNAPKAPETTETLIVADGVHLTSAGQIMLGQKVAHTIENHLKTRSK
ncbi:MAG: SGNH/GDSL hydrolase family protein [Planctomycetaceae bacterium]|jgi:lysophospholipase L1-like esterase|nr:SGNH/GDSL hydrolase family protein [Planctomycetaceae bacterium]MDC0274486.1 SGNH/GDSL hydrolase family protein [Planctomycetaceae bacterium]MDC0308205.1 SGNH/GDSL hydrolase family protein [Planctomycetaceae bacterium]MDG2389763.1 SGNH/GDSL hydrolase family protein [Planctomycetaceae bacterium]